MATINYIQRLPVEIIRKVIRSITNIYDIEGLFVIFDEDLVYDYVHIIDMIQTDGENLSYDEYKRLFPIVKKCVNLHHYNLHLDLILNEGDITNNMFMKYAGIDLYRNTGEYIYISDEIYRTVTGDWIVDRLQKILTDEASDKLMNYRIITNSSKYYTSTFCKDLLIDKLVDTYLMFKPDFCVVKPFLSYENGVIFADYETDLHQGEMLEKLELVSSEIKQIREWDGTYPSAEDAI
jgi:hypothetical protein